MAYINATETTHRDQNSRPHGRLLWVEDDVPQKPRQRRGMKRTIGMVFLHASILSISLKPNLVEARVGYMRTKPILPNRRSEASPYGNDVGSGSILLLEHPVSMPSSTTTSTMTTDVGILADNFQQALGAISQDEEEIHVGHLLLACDKLQNTMRNIGFNQGANDIAGNIGKIRNLYNKAPPSQRDSMPALLKYELESGIHDAKDGKRVIKDPSATMGFLWLGRTLHYQYDMFHNMLDRDEEPYEAAAHAYEDDLKQHHNWAVQKVCKAAMVSLRPMRTTTVFSKIGGFSEDNFGNQEDQATRRDLRQMMDSWKPMLSRWGKIFDDFGLDSI